MFDEMAKIDYGGHDRVETHGTCHMHLVQYPDGTRTVTLRTENLLPQGGTLEFHWGCIYEGSDEWALPPDGAQLPARIHTRSVPVHTCSQLTRHPPASRGYIA